jgi:NAD(P)-dependent dehydrogenase (short-subunit alcohol dehydrogenase family)
MARPVKEQVVVITGASSGIGRETALGFGRVGACWAISRLATGGQAAGWCGSSGYCRKALS